MTILENIKTIVPMVVKEIIKQYKGDIERTFIASGSKDLIFKARTVDCVSGVNFSLKFTVIPKNAIKHVPSVDTPANALNEMQIKMMDVLIKMIKYYSNAAQNNLGDEIEEIVKLEKYDNTVIREDDITAIREKPHYCIRLYLPVETEYYNTTVMLKLIKFI